MSKPPYEQKVRHIAEEMVKADPTPVEGVLDHEQQLACYIPAARIAVKHMADEVRKWCENYAWTEDGIDEYLIKAGLIPSPEKKAQ